MKNIKGIYFDEFPGRPYASSTDKKKIFKKIILWSIITLVLIILLIFSSFLNEWYLTKNTDDTYKTVNDFSGNSAIIKPNDRSKLFLDIGFDNSVQEVIKENDNSYITTYAYKNKKEDLMDQISVYYDDNYKVNYVFLSLIYFKNDFTKAGVANDCNFILRNFVNVKTATNDINNLMENDYYFTINKNTNIEVSYELTYENTDYYIITVTCKL